MNNTLSNLNELSASIIATNKSLFENNRVVQFNYYYSNKEKYIYTLIHHNHCSIFTNPLLVITYTGNSYMYNKTANYLKQSINLNEGIIIGGILSSPNEFIEYNTIYKNTLIQSYGGIVPYNINSPCDDSPTILNWPRYSSDILNNLLLLEKENNNANNSNVDYDALSFFIKGVIKKYLPSFKGNITLRNLNLDNNQVRVEILEDIPFKDKIYMDLKSNISKDLRGSININI